MSLPLPFLRVDILLQEQLLTFWSPYHAQLFENSQFTRLVIKYNLEETNFGHI